METLIRYVASILTLSLISLPALAAPPLLTYQGRILNADKTPLEYNGVAFRFEIVDQATETCVVYRETSASIDMTGTDGLFDMNIGLTHSYPADPSFSILDAFNNSSTLACAPPMSGTYTPSPTNSPVLSVKFWDGTAWNTISPNNKISSIPYAAQAMAADKLGTNVAADFVLKTGIPNCGSGSFLTWNSTTKAFGCSAGSSGGTVTGVTSANAYLTVANGTVAPVLTVNVGAVANTVAAGNDARFTDTRVPRGAAGAGGGDLTGTYPDPSIAKLQGVTVTATSPTSGNFLKYNGTAWVPAAVTAADLGTLSITNADVAAGAGIVDTKLATISTVGKVANSATTATASDVVNTIVLRDGSGNFAAGDVSLSSLVLRSSTFTATLTAPTLTASYVLALPTGIGTNGQVLTSNGTGGLIWSAASSGSVTTVTGTAPVVSSGGSTPAISMAKATSSVDGYLDHGDFATFAGKMSSSLAHNDIFVGNSSGVATAVAMSGDTTIDDTGAVTIGASKVTTSKIADSAVNVAKLMGTTPGISRILATDGTTGTTVTGLACTAGQLLSWDVTLGWTCTDMSTVAASITGLTDANIAAGAGIVDTKLATISTAGKVANSATTATASDVVSTIVARDGSGNFAAGDVSLSSIVLRNSTFTATLKAPTLTASYVLALPPGIGSNGQVLISDGTGGLQWSTAAGGSLTSVTGTAPIVSSGGAAPAISIAQATSSVDGYLAHTDFTTFSGKMSSTLAHNDIFVGNSSGVAVAVPMSGDTTIADTGAVTIATSAVTTAKIADSAVTTAKILGSAPGKSRIIATDTSTGANMVALACTAGQLLTWDATNGWICTDMSTVTSSITGLTDANIAAGAGIVDTKLATISTAGKVANSATTATASDVVSTIVARDGSGNFAAGDVSLSSLVLRNGSFTATLTAPTLAASYVLALPPDKGTNGQVLTSNGSGALVWSAASAGSVTAVTGTAPIVSSGGATPAISIAQATSSVDGYLAHTDFATFSGKMSSALTAGNIFVGNASNIAVGVAPSGDVSAISSAGAVTVVKTTTGENNKILSLDGSSIGTMSGLALVNTGTITLQAPTSSTTYSLSLPGTAGSANQVLTTSGATGLLSWTTPSTTDSTKLPLAGGTMTGNIDMGTHNISNAGTITAAGVVTGNGINVNGGGTGSMQLKYGNTSTSSTLTFPSTSPAIGQVLAATDTVGTLAWTSAATGSVTAVTGTAPVVSSGGATPAISMAQATSSVDGYLAHTDFATFNGKMSSTLAHNDIFVGNSSGIAVAVPMSGDTTIADTGAVTIATSAVTTAKIADSAITTAKILGSAPGKSRIIATDTSTGANMVALSCTAGQILAWDATNGWVCSSVTSSITGLTDANIAAGAGIVDTKLATISTAGKVANSATTATNLNTASAIVARDGSGGFSAGDVSLSSLILRNGSFTATLTAPTLTASYVLALPTGVGTNGQVLTSNGSGGMTWSSAAAGTVTAVTGTAPIVSSGGATPAISIAQATSSVDGYLAHTDFATFTGKMSSALTTGHIFVGNGSAIATDVAMSGDATISSAGALTVGTGAITTTKIADTAVSTVKIADSAVNVAKLMGTTPGINRILATDGTTGTTVAGLACTSGQLLTWNTSTGWTCTAQSALTTSAVTSVIAGTGLTGGTITSTGTIAVDVGTAASKIPQFGSNKELITAGQIVSAGFDNTSTGSTFSFNNSNVMYTTNACSTFTLTNMQDGGSYSLVVKNTSGTCAFTVSGATVHYAGGVSNVTITSHTVFTFIKAVTSGTTDVYVTWVTF